jgi:hypothetical protein
VTAASMSREAKKKDAAYSDLLDAVNVRAKQQSSSFL